MSKLDRFFEDLDVEGYRGEAWGLSREDLDDRRRRLVEVLGFTREHVEMLRAEAKQYWMLADPENYGAAEEAADRDSLADLIEALVQPEGTPEEGGTP